MRNRSYGVSGPKILIPPVLARFPSDAPPPAYLCAGMVRLDDGDELSDDVLDRHRSEDGDRLRRGRRRWELAQLLEDQLTCSVHRGQAGRQALDGPVALAAQLTYSRDESENMFQRIPIGDCSADHDRLWPSI